MLVLMNNIYSNLLKLDFFLLQLKYSNTAQILSLTITIQILLFQ